MESQNNKRLNFFQYQPGQFADLAELPFAEEVWAYLTESDTIKLLHQSVADGVPAVMPISDALRERFDADPTICASEELPRLKTMCLNMVKQIMEQQGFQHIACGLLPAGAFFSSAAIFSKD